MYPDVIGRVVSQDSIVPVQKRDDTVGTRRTVQVQDLELVHHLIFPFIYFILLLANLFIFI
jgi:hypothetical protein